VGNGALTRSEPIAGYTPIERIGAGGYGEVWKADAPGGLVKAIKFVYGHMDDARAARELKALNRIKQVRHPFLLSLERIEVVDGQLLIVTELADMSLKDRYEECRGEGLTGIPREELLIYLRDAADALDYMREKFSLQHLDVKPENLLLVGGRVKVADFGLVKDLHEVSMSMMGGMTPVYAPPEVFDDRASEYSDQYSLAIVYQEMLTGVLPFPGRTPAQLAAQHLHSPPLIGSLPQQDREPISQALAKDPTQRYPSCKALVDELLTADRPRSAAGGEDTSDPPRAESNVETATLASSDTSHRSQGGQLVAPSDSSEESGVAPTLPPRPSDVRRSSQLRKVVASLAPAPVYDLPPLELMASDFGLRPTLIVGAGGTAGNILLSLRRRLYERFGSLDGLPAWDVLLLDTDRKQLGQSMQADAAYALSAPHQTLAIPLRRPQDYRSDSKKFLNWLSRRWLYNIPRSLETNGIRPLGRLALVDHGRTVAERIRDSLARITDGDAIQRSLDTSGMNLRNRSPRIFVLASSSGGTGSGMVLDLGFALRQALAEFALPDDGLSAMLLHATSHDPNAAELSIANTYACLTELFHYEQANQPYPGAPSLGLEATRPEEKPFEDTYLVHLGDGLSPDEYAEAADRVANYLYLDTTTAAGACLDQCRALTKRSSKSATREPQLRSFGISEIACDVGRAAQSEADRVCRRVVQRWLGRNESSKKGDESRSRFNRRDVEKAAAECATTARLDVGMLLTHLHVMVERTLGHDASSLARQMSEEHLSGGSQHVESAIPKLFKAIEATVEGRVSTDDEDDESQAVQMALSDHVALLSKEQLDAIRRYVLELANEPAGRLTAAEYAKEWFAKHFDQMRTELSAERDNSEQEKQELRQKLSMAKPQRSGVMLAFWSRKNARREPENGLEADLTRYCELRLRDVAIGALGELLDANSHQLRKIDAQILQMRRVLERLTESFQSSPKASASPTRSADRNGDPAASIDLTASVQCALHESLSELMGRIDARFQEDFLSRRGGLSVLAEGDAELVGALPQALRQAAWTTMREAAQQVDVAGVFLDQQADVEPIKQLLRQCPSSAMPAVLEAGGAKRMLAVLPLGDGAERLQELVDEVIEVAPTVVRDADRGITFCCEAEQLPLAKLAARIVLHHPNAAKLAGRIHSRNDVDWTEFQLPGQS